MVSLGDTGVDVILGTNGNVWISRELFLFFRETGKEGRAGWGHGGGRAVIFLVCVCVCVAFPVFIVVVIVVLISIGVGINIIAEITSSTPPG